MGASFGGSKRSIGPLPFVIAAGVIIAGAFTWFIVSRGAVAPEAKAVCTLIIDRTGSSDTDEIKSNYLNAAKATIEGCRADDGVLSIYRIDGQSGRSERVGGPYEFFDEDQKKQGVAQRTFDDREAEATAVAEQAINEPATSGGGSEILSALDETAKATNASYGDLDAPKYVVILTDGLQNSPAGGISVGGLIDGSTTADELVTQTQQLGLEPESLARSCINMVGVKGGEGFRGEPIDPVAETRLENYWNSIFSNTGATLEFYGKQALALPAKC